MPVSLDSTLLKLLTQTQAAQAGTPSKSEGPKKTSSDFAQILASSLINNSSSQMLNSLSNDTDSEDAATSDTNSNLNGLGGVSSSNSSDDLLWNLLSNTLDPSSSTNASSSSDASSNQNAENLSSLLSAIG